ANNDDAYVVDTIPIPERNPYGASTRLAGLDFFSDPTRAAVCTWKGDVWIVSGIDEKLDKVRWRRYASGLFDALGLKIVDDVVYVHGRDQITRLHDLNGDGEADHYECFNNDVTITKNFHEFAFDLHTDRDGNFYFSKGGPVRPGGRGFDKIVPHHGCVLRVSKDGSKLDVYATGLRAPNGIGVSPDGQVTTGDNEGSWVPRCRLSWCRPGSFEGVVDTSQQTPKPKDYNRPLCWFPKSVDNSSGGQVWVTSDRWGPLQGELLHLSYGQTALYRVLKESVGGQVQGGVVKFPMLFDSGVMRGRFNQGDGQLYLVGLRGWQSRASRGTCFQRVRYTGAPVRMPSGLRAKKGRLEIEFTTELDRRTAERASRYSIHMWNYLWTEDYGSPEVSVVHGPSRRMHDKVEIEAVTLSKDGRTVTLKMPGLRPCMQMKIAMNLRSSDGHPLRHEIYNTIHRLGE
ncbi:MAG: cytochrome C, partial [Planctomycetota bacterium]